MLNRFISIRNVGRFRNCAARGDVSLGRVTLFFAENGRGKTTLCAILRSLVANQPALVLGRATLGTPDPPEIQILTVTGAIAFRDGNWSNAYPEIAIFDGTYVSENVYAGDAVSTDHRRNLYRVIIGAPGVMLAARIDGLDARVREKNSEIRENRVLIQRHIPQGLTVEAFVALDVDAAIDAKIAAKEQELNAARQAMQLQQRAGLLPLALPVFPTSFAALLAKTLDDVAADAETRVLEHMARHGMQGRGENWLIEGLGYASADSCPFCGRNLDGIELVRDFKAFFSREYGALRSEVTTLREQVDAALGDRVVANVEQVLLQNNGALEWWAQYCALVPAELRNAHSVGATFGALREAAQQLLTVKAAAPLEAVPPDQQFTEALGAFEAMRAEFGDYNATVATANAVIAVRRQEAQAADVQTIERQLAVLRAQRARHTDEGRRLCNIDVRLQEEKNAIEEEKRTVRQELDVHTQQVITTYGQRINWYLERINASFRVTTPTHNYRGGTPSTSYQILINESAVDLGDADTPPDRPSFRNTLSAGDRTTLALAFFFAQLEQDPNRANKVVVFDDPFTSMDGFRRTQTVHQICRCAANSAQVVVLSHEPGFLHLLWEQVGPADRKSLAMARIGEANTTIIEWDIERAVQARYRADLATLQRFLSLAEGEQRDVIQKIRPVLESYCRTLCPADFSEQDLMGAIIAKIREVGAAHPLFAIIDELEELNAYCRRFHHGEGRNPAAERIDEAELQGYVRMALRLVGYVP